MLLKTFELEPISVHAQSETNGLSLFRIGLSLRYRIHDATHLLKRDVQQTMLYVRALLSDETDPIDVYLLVAWSFPELARAFEPGKPTLKDAPIVRLPTVIPGPHFQGVNRFDFQREIWRGRRVGGAPFNDVFDVTGFEFESLDLNP